jgi:hypothetical protein
VSHEWGTESQEDLVELLSEKAKATLLTLKGICGNCEESRDLEKAINSAQQ